MATSKKVSKSVVSKKKSKTSKRVTPTKSALSTKKTTVAKKSVRRASKPPVVELTADTRQRLMRPPPDAIASATQILNEWERVRKQFRVPTTSPGKLKRSIQLATKAHTREEAAEKVLRRLADERLRSDDAMWRMILDINAVAKAMLRVTPELKDLVEMMSAILSPRRPGEKGEEKPVPQPEPEPVS